MKNEKIKIAREALIERITAYLTNGGLFNPEFANHNAVNELLIECREALALLNEDRGEAAQHVAYFDDGQFHWMSGIAPRNCELYASLPDAEAEIARLRSENERLREAIRTADYRMCVMENSPNLNEGEKGLFREWIKDVRQAWSAEAEIARSELAGAKIALEQAWQSNREREAEIARLRVEVGEQKLIIEQQDRDIARLRADNERLSERLEISPQGDDAIDALESACAMLRDECANLRAEAAQAKGGVRPSYARIIEIVQKQVRRMQGTNGSHSMLARWISEHIDAEIAALASPASTQEPDDADVREEQRREIERDVKSKLRLAFRKALSTLPEIAPSEIASVLASVHMQDEFLAEGKRLQMRHGLDAVAPRVEQECGAGAWSFMRQGVLAALREKDPGE